MFTTREGKPARTLYHSLIQACSELRIAEHSAAAAQHLPFGHPATFRLTEGVEVYFLAKQMGTSVKMIEDHYGHITPVKNAEQILKGLPGWEHEVPAP